jgi:hypothetical protein
MTPIAMFANCWTGFICAEFQNDISGLGKLWAKAAGAASRKAETLVINAGRIFFIIVEGF